MKTEFLFRREDFGWLMFRISDCKVYELNEDCKELIQELLLVKKGSKGNNKELQAFSDFLKKKGVLE